MSLFTQFTKALNYIFKGPGGTIRKKVKRSTTHTRYTSQPKPKQKKKPIESPRKRKKAPKPVKAPKAKAPAKVKTPLPPKVAKTAVAKVKVPKPVKAPKPAAPEFYVGEITHYFAKISVVVLKVVDHPVLMGDTIHIKGSADFTQKVESLQVESKDVRFARRGELVGLKTIQPAKPGDKVYKSKK